MSAKVFSNLSWSLLQVRGHFHTAFIQQSEFFEEQSELPKVFLELPKAVLIRCLALSHPIRKLNQKHTIDNMNSFGIITLFLNTAV